MNFRISKTAISLAIAATMTMPMVASAQNMELSTDEQKYSYAVGTKLAEQIAKQFGADSGVDLKALAAGISDVVSGATVQMSAQEADDFIASQQARLAEEAQAAAAAAVQKGKDYMLENGKKEGVVETESGIQYTVINKAEDSADMPTATDTVVVNYRGTLINGEEFDSSYSRGVPATFPLNGIIPGWGEVLQLMRVGDKWSVVIPPELAYGERGAGGSIGPNETLIFEIELLEVKKG